MGFFKDLRDMKKMADDMTAQTGGRPSLRDTVSQGKEAMGMAQEQLALAQQLQVQANPNARTGRATINAIRDTGMTINEDPVVEMQMNVTDADGSMYAIVHQQIVSRLRLAQIQPGAEVQVRIDPQDRNKLLIV
jgi:hypothetical protein